MHDSGKNKPFHILLVNSWVYDFAVFNLWARPLGLLKVAEFLSQYNIDITFIDCMEGLKSGKYNTGKYPKTNIEKPEILKDIPRRYSPYGMDVDFFKEKVKKARSFDAVFITSIMTYWWQGVAKTVEIIREIDHKTFVILGGIYATLFPEHAENFIKPHKIHKGPISEEAVHCALPEGLNKIRNPLPYYRKNFYNRLLFAPILTSVGCPFACTYCASPFLNKIFSQRSHEDVLKEIIELFKAGVRDFAFYDDALLMNANQYIKPLLREVAHRKLKVRFHCPNGIHAKFIDDEIAYLMKITGFKTIRLGLETVNGLRQQETGGKIRTDEFIRGAGFLKKNGFTKKEMGAYLLYGLHKQPLSEVMEGIKFLMSLDIGIKLSEFSPMPNTATFKELVAKGVIDSDIDPLLTNNTVFSYLFSGYNRKEIDRLKQLAREYNQN